MKKRFNLEDSINDILKLAIRAGEETLKFYHKPKTLNFKKDKSPLTQADLNSNDIIMSGLKKINKNFKIISEENNLIPYTVRKKWNSFWMLDPLDGTKEFLNKNGQFTINIAYLKYQKPIFGVIYAPYKKLLYYALKNKGSYKHRIKSRKEKIKLFNNRNKIECRDSFKRIKVIASRSHSSEYDKKWLSKLNNYNLVNIGSSLKLCFLADGQADVYPRFAGSSEWDIAAGNIILEEANGQILNLNNCKIKYNKKLLRNKFFIASSRTFLNYKKNNIY